MPMSTIIQTERHICSACGACACNDCWQDSRCQHCFTHVRIKQTRKEVGEPWTEGLTDCKEDMQTTFK
jgi:hypothetical protein